MTCEELVIGSVAGLALTAGLLSFQVLTDRKAARTEDRKKIATSGTITYWHDETLFHDLYATSFLKYLVTTSNHYQFV
jgi:hypothetical protein